MAGDAQIIAIADNSPLATYYWPERDYAPRSYLRGMAIAFERAFAMLKGVDESVAEEAANPLGASAQDLTAWRAGKDAVARATAEPLGSAARDVLAWYRGELAAAGASLDKAADKLVGLFAIMLGLGMQESSGAHCVGADTPESRGEPTTEENAEAGLFQVSHDSIDGDAQRQALFDAYRSRTDMLSLFGSGLTCSAADWCNCGSGAGAEFQNAMKRCPLFAVLYTALYLRQSRSHWGPIKSKKAEAKAEAVAFFTEIADLIQAS